jgi:effector-binding domain-containing protein
VTDLADFYARSIPAVAAEMQRDGITPAGPPIAAYRHELGHTFEVTVDLPVTRLPDTDALIQLRLPGGHAAQALHQGTHEPLSETYGQLGEWWSGRHLRPPEILWEEYVAGPDEAGDDRCLTRVVCPVP